MKNVLVTATTFPRWENDTEPNFVFALSSLLAKKGFNIIVLAPHHPNAEKCEIIGNLKIYRFPYFYPNKLQKLCYDGGVLENMKKSLLAKLQAPLLLMAELLHTARIIKKEKIDFIHAHWIIPQGLTAACIKKLYRIPFISTAHAGDVFTLKKKPMRDMARAAIANSSYVTANSNYTRNSILKILNFKKDIEIIPMGVDLSQFSPRKKDQNLREKLGVGNKLILFVGRLAEKKGVEYLIRAMPTVLEKLPKSKLVVIGDGPRKEKLANLVAELNLENDVAFLGKIKNEELPKYYATADVFVGPSIVTKSGDTEGLGIVFLEAIASGTCIIGSNVGGIPDIVKHNTTGILVEEKNVKELESAIVAVLKDNDLQKKLKRNSMEYIKKTYSWDIVAEKFAKLYRRIK